MSLFVFKKLYFLVSIISRPDQQDHTNSYIKFMIVELKGGFGSDIKVVLYLSDLIDMCVPISTKHLFLNMMLSRD